VAALARGTDRASAGDLPGAAAAYREARRLALGAEDPAGAAEALDRLAHAEAAAGRSADAERLHLDAAAELEALGRGHRRGLALSLAGKAALEDGRPKRALDHFEEAALVLTAAGDRREASIAHRSRGTALEDLGRTEPALTAYRQALEILADLPEPVARAHALHNLGRLEIEAGELRLGGDHLQRAEELLRQTGRERELSRTLLALSSLALAQREWERAEALLRRSREAAERLGDRRAAAVAVGSLGLLSRQRGDFDRALGHYRDALAAFEALDDRWMTARTLQHLGRLHLARGEAMAAEAAYRRAFALTRDSGDPASEAESRLGLARAARQDGQLDRAVEHSAAGLAILESLRGEILGPSLATSWFATVQDHYRFAVELAMELDRTRPGAGWAARGFEIAERSRARTLLETLDGGAQAWGEAAAELRERLSRAERRRLGLLEAGAPRGEVEAAEREVRALLSDLEEARLEWRKRRPGDPGDARPAPLGAEAVRARLGGPDVRLLEIALGEERSVLWLIGPAVVEAFELPPGPELEALARRAHGLLARSRAPEAEAAARTTLCTLSHRLLAPAAGSLAGRRLLVVADGALRYLPFAALPDPRRLRPDKGPGEGCGAGEAPPLGAAFQVVHAPSASAAVRLLERGRRPGAGAWRGTVAVLADPVFGADDPRLAGGDGAAEALTGDLARSAAAAGLSRLPRLPGTRREAEAILARVPAGAGRGAFGFAATKEAVLDGGLAGYRYVHLATHGFVHDEHPELSGVVLSLVDPDGRPRDGFLRAHEIAGLELPAELVVLSACRTALGREVGGEGLVGLTQALLGAGARGVLLSLWDVGDRSTAELMDRFYRGLLEEGLPPAEALRQAQLGMAADPRWRSPYHWAGFVLLGAH
jgi:CHAT domain-containing protein/predicted negative regulator of RcsB-dependent stress response